MATASAYADLNDFIDDRASWLRVTAVKNEFGGHDVVLRIDGSYSFEGDAEDMAKHFRQQLAPLLKALGHEKRMIDWNLP